MSAAAEPTPGALPDFTSPGDAIAWRPRWLLRGATSLPVRSG